MLHAGLAFLSEHTCCHVVAGPTIPACNTQAITKFQAHCTFAAPKLGYDQFYFYWFFIDNWFQIDMGRTSRRKARVPPEAEDEVPDPNKTLPQWKALSKEALVLRCQALNLVATGGVPKLAKTLHNWYRDKALAAIQNGGPRPSNQGLVQETQVNPTQVPAIVTVRDPDVLNQHQLPLPDPLPLQLPHLSLPHLLLPHLLLLHPLTL